MAAPSSAREADPLPPVAAALLDLAPLRMPQRRNTRYDGDQLCIALEGLAARDQTLLRDLYKVLSQLLYDIADERTSDAEKWVAVKRWTQQHDLDALFRDIRELGHASRERTTSEEVAMAMHDVRGGALNALLGRLQLLERLPRDETQLRTLFVLARDHLKIMRNAITGLDEARRRADTRPKAHNMKLMVEKWHDSIIGPKWRERPVRMVVDCRYEGALTECCLESAAVDRIFYNLANNASRHAVGDHVEMTIFPVSQPPTECLRFVLSNEVKAEDAAFLRGLKQPESGAGRADQSPGLSLPRLFEPAMSSTGSGFGLTVVADFVARAFGLRDRAEALRERYVGALLDGGTFRVWFHWPMANGDLPKKLDDFRRPEESLSEP